MYVQLGRENIHTLEKRSYAALHLKKNGKQAIIPTAEFGIISAETACWDRERK
jgi:hypothetical protein